MFTVGGDSREAARRAGGDEAAMCCHVAAGRVEVKEPRHSVTGPFGRAAGSTRRYVVAMKRVLLTGMSGTGKSTVINELAARGYKAVDTDDHGLSEWVAVPWTSQPAWVPGKTGCVARRPHPTAAVHRRRRGTVPERLLAESGEVLPAV
jgi:hypothetical protein